MAGDREFPLILTREQVRFEILYGLMQVPRSIARNWLSKDRSKAERARELMTGTILARFDRLEVRGRCRRPAQF